MRSGAHGEVGPACIGGASGTRSTPRGRPAEADRHERHRGLRYTGKPVAASRTPGHRLAHVSVGAAIGLGALLGLAIGILVSIATGVPLAPEAGLVLGALLGWLSRRNRA